MSVTLTIRDETSSGQTLGELSLDFLNERITIRELIRSRVYQEVQDYNLRRAQNGVFHGLVQPAQAERELNGRGVRPGREIDWKKQFDVALEAFERNGFLILVDDHQAAALDEEIELTPATRVSFLKLVPLVGG